MRTNGSIASATALGLLFAVGACKQEGDAVKADNTAVNERDRNETAKTPLDQKENERDLKVTQDIRQAVVADDALSFDAKNAKIITADGVVTLRGPVKTQAEKDAIETKAKSVAGVTRVDNQLEIAP
jgi:hyperosmotically inducible periplasmic protein